MSYFFTSESNFSAGNPAKQSDERFENIAQNVPGIFYQMTVTQTGKIQFSWVSPHCIYWLGIEAAAIQNNAEVFLSQFPLEDRQHFEQSLQDAIQNLSDWYWQGKIFNSSGETFWVQNSANLQQDEDQNLLWNGVVVKIPTPQNQFPSSPSLEKQLEQKTEALQETIKQLQQTQTQLVQIEHTSSLGHLIAGIAHEINNPINFIYGNLTQINNYTTDLLELIKLYEYYFPYPTPELEDVKGEIDLDFIKQDLPNLLSSIQVGANRIREIVNSLRLFSRIDEAEKKRVNIHAGLDSALMIVRSRMQERDHLDEIKIVKNYSDLPLVECYAGQMNQVFMNFLTNALDALEEKKEIEAEKQITITTEYQEPWIVIKIADNGIGITEENKAHLFDPFFTTKSVGKGTGLGLSISYQIIIEKHRGRLHYQSTYGQGTEFTILIPVGDSPGNN